MSSGLHYKRSWRGDAAQAATVALLNRAMMGGHNASRKASYESGRPGHSELVAAVQHAQREAQVQTASIAGGSQDTYTPQSMCTGALSIRPIKPGVHAYSRRDTW